MVAPTCTEDGYTTYTCACGDTYTDDVTEALGHDYEQTNQNDSYVYYECTRCGVTKRDHKYPIPTDPNKPVTTSVGGDATTYSLENTAPTRVLTSTVVQEYSYVYTGGSLMQMVITTTATPVDGTATTTTETLNFAYDASGIPMSVDYNGMDYYYVTNIQGDVIAILNTSGTAVVQYTYDAWGNIHEVSGSLADTLGETNPLRYRGYVYDNETEYYYLQSRYYNPEIGRFINADDYPSTGQGLTGNNMFAYCGNNPVSRSDNGGYFWEIITAAAIGGAIAGAIIGAVSYLASSGINKTEVTVSGLLGSTATGVVTGAIGAVAGAIGGVAAVVGSVIVGTISGTVTAYNTEGSATQKITAGFSAGVVAGLGTYLGTKIPVALDSNFTTGVTSFAGGLLMGTQTEIVNVATQQVVTEIFSTSGRQKTVGSSWKPVYTVSVF